ncbi:hypothetical protein CH256_17460 [Rhodococcus sp. 05-2254-6]|nr:hypothetical protein CH256_17460 [Rhodococcus sp. 05-2254-6]
MTALDQVPEVYCRLGQPHLVGSEHSSRPVVLLRDYEFFSSLVLSERNLGQFVVRGWIIEPVAGVG